MLISHEYQFIFIKTRKTAGTSLEISLSRYLGPFDVITPISPRDELLRAEMGIVPRNYMALVHKLPPQQSWTEVQLAEMLKNVEIQRRFYNHCPAEEIKAAVGERLWNSYTKFCFERNPWDRVLSEYYFIKKNAPAEFAKLSLTQFVERELYTPNFPLYVQEGSPVVNFLGRYENLQADLKAICHQLGLPYDGWLPHAKGDTRPQPKEEHELLTPHLCDLIAHRCQPEIDLFGYQPPSL